MKLGSAFILSCVIGQFFHISVKTEEVPDNSVKEGVLNWISGFCNEGKETVIMRQQSLIQDFFCLSKKEKKKKPCLIKNNFNKHACKCHAINFKNESVNVLEILHCWTGKNIFGDPSNKTFFLPYS